MEEPTQSKRHTKSSKRSSKAKTIREIFDSEQNNNLIFDKFGIRKTSNDLSRIEKNAKEEKQFQYQKQSDMLKTYLSQYIDEIRNDEMISETTHPLKQQMIPASPLSHQYKPVKSVKFRSAYKISKTGSNNSIQQPIQPSSKSSPQHIYRKISDKNSNSYQFKSISKKKSELSSKEDTYKSRILSNEVTSKILSNSGDQLIAQTIKKQLFEDNTNHETINYTINETQISPRKLKRLNCVSDSLSNDEDEILNNKDKNSKYLIHPNSKFKLIWDFIILVITIYSIILSPAFISFRINNQLIFYIELLFDIIYILDVIVNFLVPFLNFEEKIILNHKYIVLNYFFGWFFIDLVSSIPGNSIYNIGLLYNSNYLMKSSIFFSFIRLTKLFKLIKLTGGDDNTFLKKSEVNLIEELHIDSALSRIIKFGIGFLLISHILSCFWIYFASFDDTHNWIVTLGISNTISDLYISSIYFIWTTIFTVGYGDILPVNIYERVYNILLMSVGVCIYSFGLSSVSSLVTSFDNITRRFYNNLEIVEEIRKKCDNMDNEMYDKLVKYLRFDYKFNKSESFAFVAELPKKTRNMLLFKIYQTLLSKFAFFKSSNKFANEDFNSRVLLAMRPIRLYRDLVLREGETIQEMILISDGTLVAQMNEKYQSEKIFELTSNDYFGDMIIHNTVYSPFDLKVKSRVCDAFIIKKSDLVLIESEFPLIFREITKVSSKNSKSYEKMIERIKLRHDTSTDVNRSFHSNQIARKNKILTTNIEVTVKDRLSFVDVSDTSSENEVDLERRSLQETKLSAQKTQVDLKKSENHEKGKTEEFLVNDGTYLENEEFEKNSFFDKNNEKTFSTMRRGTINQNHPHSSLDVLPKSLNNLNNSERGPSIKFNSKSTKRSGKKKIKKNLNNF